MLQVMKYSLDGNCGTRRIHSWLNRNRISVIKIGIHIHPHRRGCRNILDPVLGGQGRKIPGYRTDTCEGSHLDGEVYDVEEEWNPRNIFPAFK